MELNDTREIDAPRETVWAAILDPEVLKACIPGCQELTGSPEEGFDAVVVQKVGPVKATFKGRVTLTDMTRPEALTLSGEGKGGAAGFAKGSARVTLEGDDEAGPTRLSYAVEAKVGGKLAQLGSRVIDGFAKKMAGEFFTRLKDAVEEPDGAETAKTAETAEAGTAAAPEEGAATGGPRGWFRRRKT